MEELKSEITKREQMILLLKKSGWYEGRHVDISEFEQQCNEGGIELFDSAKKFLEEFIGIENYVEFKYLHPCDDIGECDQDYIFDFITNPHDKIYCNQYQKILDFIEEDCFYLGQSGYYYPAVVAIGRSGKLYFKHDYNNKVQVFDNLIHSMLSELDDMNIITSSLLYKIEEDEHYYNNKYIVVDGIVKFERVYMVDLNKFNIETYDELEKVFENLPSYIYMENPASLPCWYGDEEKGDKYFITGSYETSGLQFWGKLPISDFLEWENKFHELIENFPFKSN